MSEKVFGNEYSNVYDLLYADKDYARECDVIEEHFRRYGDGNIRSILDLGCGTGGHATLLARKGYRVTGVDLSEDMIRIARKKCTSSETAKCPEFIVGNLQNVDLSKTFDAVIMMFAVLGYQNTNEEVSAALRTVRRHLRHGGLFVGDAWYGPAVLTILPSDKIKTVATEDGRIVRTGTTTFDTDHHTADVHYRVQRYRGECLADEATELHRMRYFFPQEIEMYLSDAVMNVLRIADYNEPQSPPSENSWNILVTAKAH